ncbi:NAD-dependent epimerase/dehydratase family protein [Halogeometricum borinquense]|uniref:Nucleoside-diphosphate-sugar epimerase n=1 Tax=Halogeometricum borinquense (strain ATCC 700274 / DSM 11551 / JCM 10706 / KCTC 4070 / PR3) TaxID=469382 RepID=E4NM66_HALBP|nr:NAD-dependent epimerase/dehydratase family protein [Halogeometricum borinquense]ADQ67271.1 nucleoside-diphosphate-sugar epimerase [Halogeometricum borinquense DSM 11551]ELY28487.1 nucleoside-diphosphate-sugar epimerase [Halogeometricum borinquense DSM 11551]QIQ76555.1 NAD-dependent epimerase/dehydratase family protein [Halogeometricum borinquense]
MSDQHAVVTGGAGFLGSHLVDSLLNDGYQVTVLDNFGSGRPENLEHVDAERFETINHDVSEPFPSLNNVGVVYHFASRASPKDFDSHAVEIALANGMGTHNALQFASEHEARVVLASTSEVYGDPEEHPQHEEYRGNVNVRGPRAPYDESKRFAEALAVAYEAQHSLDIRTVRIFNTYGPRMRQDDGRVIPNFLTQALEGKDLTVYGDGSQTRSFCYVSDLIAGIRAFADAPSEVAKGEVVNVGNTDEVTIFELAELILEIVDTDSDITYEPLPEDDPKIRRPDISKATGMLDWEPTIGLEKGLKRTIEAFDD